MKKLFLAIVLVLQTFVCAEKCYFQTRRISYDSVTKVKKISCQKAKNAVGDVRYYNGRDNYTPYFEENFGREGNIIMEEKGYTLFAKFYYAFGHFRLYGSIIYQGANPAQCFTTTSTGYCDRVEYNEFAMYLNDFLNSSARKAKRK